MTVRLLPVTTEAQAAYIVEQAKKPENAEFFRRQSPVCTWPKETLSWWANMFIVERLSDEKPLGVLSLGAIDAQNKNLEFGMFLDKEACKPASRRAVAVEAINGCFLDYVFNYLQYEKVYSRTLPHRESIFSGYEEWGFNKDAVLRRNVWFDGDFRDEVVYSLLRSEWKK